VKRWTPLLVVFLVAAATPLFALDEANRTDRGRRTVLVVDEVIRMSQAGVGDDAIISYVRHTREPFDVSADDIIALTDARVSRDVVKAVVDEAAAWKDRDRDRRGDRAGRVYVTAYPYYDPFFYPYYYDPFFYGPRFFVSFGFGPRFIGRGFRRHR
jgi:hypothetical protein